jgi:hypothetical protein
VTRFWYTFKTLDPIVVINHIEQQRCESKSSVSGFKFCSNKRKLKGNDSKKSIRVFACDKKNSMWPQVQSSTLKENLKGNDIQKIQDAHA